MSVVAKGEVERFPLDESASESRCLCPEELERAFPLFGAVGTNEVEVAPVGGNLGEEISATVELFAIEKLIFDQAMNGFNVTLPGVAFEWDEAMI